MPRPNRSRMPAAIDDIDAITPCPLSEPLPTQLGGGALDISITMDGACGSVAAVHGLADLDLGSASASTNAVTSRSSSPVSECASPTSSMTASCCSSSCSKKNTRSSSTSSAGSSSSRRRDSLRALEEGTDGDPERLWRRMLALQQIYGCYNSARMSAALSSGDASLLLPSKACLDLLNENMTLLPDDAELALGGGGAGCGGWRPRSQPATATAASVHV